MKSLEKTGIFFAVFGGLFASIGLWFFWSDHQFAAAGTSTVGTVIEVERRTDSDGDAMFRPRVQYRDDRGANHVFSSDISSSNFQYAVGERVTVIYDPENSNSAIIDSFFDRHLLPMIFAAMGGLFVVIGGVLAGLPTWSRYRIKQLKLHGIAIEGTTTSVAKDTRITINGSNPWRVKAAAKHPKTGTIETYKSEMLWERPLTIQKGDKVTVYVAPTKPSKGHVDVASARHSNTHHRQQAAWIPPGRGLPS